MSRAAIVATAVVAGLSFLCPASGAIPKIKTTPVEGGVLLYDPTVHGTDVINNGRAKGGALQAVAKIVRKAGKPYTEFQYTGTHGQAKSTFYYERLPEPAGGRRHAGIKLIIDYDGKDYAKLDVTARFWDQSQVGTRLTLGPGENEYVFDYGFRRAHWTTAWHKLSWLQFRVYSVKDKGNPIRWRLGRMVMMEKAERRKPQPMQLGRIRKTEELLGRKSSAPGDIDVLNVIRTDNRDKEHSADFHAECALRSFPAGTYRARWQVDGSEVEPQEDTLTLDGRLDVARKFTVRKARNKNGSYTFRLTLRDAKGRTLACAAEFVNSLLEPDLFGKRLLSPRPKHVAWGTGAFEARRHSALSLPANATARTAKTAEIFCKKYYDHTGVRLATKRYGAVPASRGIVLRLGRAAAFKGKPSALRPDGYCLNVGKERVVVTGGDERGLYYGMITFFQLMKNDFKIQARMPVPCVEILDWPDLPNRMMMTSHGCAWHYMTYGDNWGIDYFIDWVDRFVAQNKANVLYSDMSRSVRYERQPRMGRGAALYSLDDLRKLGRFCRDNFVDVCPAWQIGGHANWWLLGRCPELREKGYNNQGDVTHPDHNKVVFDCMLDVIEALGCKYASPKGDEWWGGGRKKGETPADVVRGLTKAERYLDFHVKCHAFLKSKGVRMMMFHDMLSPYHNGQHDGLYKLIDRYPRDIIINEWGGLRSLRWFAEKGFEVWGTPNGGGGLYTEHKQLVKGFGNIIYSLGTDRARLKCKRQTMHSTHSLCRAADFGWNAYDYPGDEPGRAVSLQNLFALRPTGQAAERAVPLDLAGAFTHSLGAYFKEAEPDMYGDVSAPVPIKAGVRDVAHVPMRLAASTGRNCIVLREKGGGVSIPVNARYASLVFLHTALINDPKDKRARPGMGRKWPYGFPCGEYVVHYADGEERVLPVRLTLNVRRFNASSRNRATNENRYVYVVRDHVDDPVHLYQWEWVNPRPGQEIKSITARHDDQLDVSLILVAVSGRELWAPARTARTGGRL